MTRFRVTRKPPAKPQGEWLRLSHEMTWAIDEMADSDHYVVHMSPEAGYDDNAYDDNGKLILNENGEPVGQQHPGVTFPALGIVEINPKYIPEDVTPESMRPDWNPDHRRYPVIWGLVAHEAAHARTSKWMDEVDQRRDKLTPDEMKAVGAAVLLEESRIEHKQMEFRPQDQVWLSASGTQLALKEISAQLKKAKSESDPDAGFQANKIAVSRAAALVLARIDAGSVYPDEATDEIQKLVNTTFGDAVAEKLREIWVEAQNTDDDDSAAMLALGKKWYDLTGDSGDAPEEEHVLGVAASGQGDGEGSGKSALEEALAKAASNATREANGEAENQRQASRIKGIVDKRIAEALAQQEAADQAGRASPPGQGNSRHHPVVGWRDPDAKEMSLARSIRKALQAAYVPERAVTRVTNNLPPGRLDMRSVQQLDAQSAMGLLPDAEPFVYKDRKHVATPPLKVGIIQDVSGSQGGAAAAAASGAWSLAKAASMITDAQVAMVTFGDAVHKVFGPYERLPKVPKFSTNYGTNFFLESLQAIEGMLQLQRSGSARLVVVLTDWQLMQRDKQGMDAAIKRLTDFGVKFLLMATDGGSSGLPKKGPNIHLFTKAAGNFEIVPKVIGVEAVNALKKR